jgi:PAS domain S-box-containing protein
MTFEQRETDQPGLHLRIERLERELREKDTQLELINQVGGMLTSELELEKVVQKVTDIATTISKAQFGALFYNKVNQDGEAYTLYTLSGAMQEDFARFPMPRNTAVFGPTFRGEGIVRSDDITRDPRYGKNRPYSGMPQGHLPVRSYMAIPVVSKGGKVLGGLFFGHPEPGVFTGHEEDLVRNIASQAAVALDNAHLYEAKLEAEQRKSREQISTILESITDGFFTIDPGWKVTYWNQEAERVSGRKRGELLHRDIRETFGKSDLSSLYHRLYLSVSRRRPVGFTGYYPPSKSWLSISAYPSQEGLTVYFKDITRQRQAEELERLGKRVLQLNTRPDSRLEDTITYYLRGLERIHPGMLCAVLLREGPRLYPLAAPSLPAFYREAITGVPVGPDEGSCGAAAFTAQKVASCDIEQDPRWAKYKATARKANLKASWSIPIISSAQRVLGTFAVYYQEAGLPTPEEEHSVESTTNLLQLILENKLIENALRQSNERYDLAASATNDAIWEWDVVTGRVYQGPVYGKIFGHKGGEDEATHPQMAHVHPDDRERVAASVGEALQDAQASLWQEEYRYLRKDGTYAHVLDRAYISRGKGLEATRMVGAMHDASEAKSYEAERELLIEELKRNNSDLKQFSYIASHNLRAPLANLLGLLRLIRPETITDSANRMLAVKFQEATYKLSDTLEDLLDILVIKNRAGLKLEHVSLSGSLKEVTESVDHLIKESAACVTTDFSEGESVYVNAAYLHSVLLNLLTNAVKYRSPERPLRIHLETRAHGEKLELRFSDNGQGIDLERYGERVFGLYQRFHRHENSKGIGLFIAQSQIKAMGGSIEVESQVDKGTAFIILLRR